MKPSFLTLLAAMASAASAPAVEDVSAILLRKTQIFSDAGQRGDGGTMAGLLDDHVVFFNEGGDQATKQDMAANRPTGGQAGVTTRMTVTDWHCEVHGDVAVASFIDDQQQDWHGQPFHARYRSVETWLREKGEWRMIASETIALNDDPPTMSVPPATLDDYVGTYEAAPGVRFTFTRKADDIYASTAGGPPTIQKAAAPDLFFTPGRSRLTKLFQRDASGHIVGFALRREGHDIRFRRILAGASGAAR